MRREGSRARRILQGAMAMIAVSALAAEGYAKSPKSSETPVDEGASRTSGPSAAASGTAKPSEPPSAGIRAEILVLHATNEGKGIDPAIGKLPQLGQPPFSAYNTYKLVERANLQLPKGELRDQKLPDGGKLALTLKDSTATKKPGDAARHQLVATIEKPGGKPFLPKLEVSATAGELFFVAGQQYQGGILVLGIKLLP